MRARPISADPYVQSPLWGQGLNRYSYGYNNPMSGSDPSGYGWLDKVFGDSTGWEGTAAFGGFGILVVGGAYLGTGGLGGVGFAHATSGLSDPGANATYAAPTGELGSGAWSQNRVWGNTATQVARIQVPAGTMIFEGEAAAQGALLGGGNQVFIPSVNPAWLLP